MIKQAQTTDLERIIPLGQLFFEECELPGTFNPQVFIETFTELMVNDMAEVWIAEEGTSIVGAIGGLFTRDIFTGDLVAVENFWYVHKDFRRTVGLRLFDRFREQAIARGMRRLQMGAIIHSTSFLGVRELFRKYGMMPLETYFTLTLQ